MGGKRRAFLKITGLMVCAAILAFNYSAPMRAVRELPDEIYGSYQLNAGRWPFFTVETPDGDTAAVASDLGETLGGPAGSKIEIALFGRIPIKTIQTHPAESRMVMPGGCAVGITMHTNGLLVVGLGSFTSSGIRTCPAEAAKLRAGDIIVSANGADLLSTLDFTAAISSGGPVELIYKRGGESRSATLVPMQDDDTGGFRAGMWIRESTVGIGTLSYYFMEDGHFGALGHAVTDIDTGATIEIRKGTVVSANVIGVLAGVQGAPGELRGTFGSRSQELGSITANTELGVFGDMSGLWVNPLYPDGVELARPDEAVLGAATLLTTVDEGGVKEYSCEIMKLSEDGPLQKSMVVKVTDEELIALTGGIVQGMSGSPVIQNGKLIGAITHVLVNDPTRGYGISIKAMITAGEEAA